MRPKLEWAEAETSEEVEADAEAETRLSAKEVAEREREREERREKEKQRKPAQWEDRQREWGSRQRKWREQWKPAAQARIWRARDDGSGKLSSRARQHLAPLAQRARMHGCIRSARMTRLTTPGHIYNLVNKF